MPRRLETTEDMFKKEKRKNQQRKKRELPAKQKPTERPRRKQYENLVDSLPPDRQQVHLRAWLAGIIEYLTRRGG